MACKQRAEERNYLIEELGSGAFATVYLSIPKTTADTIIATSKTTGESKASTITKLRSNLQAIKIRKDSEPYQPPAPRKLAVIDREVATLQHLAGLSHPNLIQLTSADPLPQERAWLTMLPVCNGGSYEAFLTLTGQRDAPAVPVAFIWHIYAQLGRALLYLHFGVHGVQKEQVAEWPLIAHSDLNASNIMFRSGGAEGTGNYPDVLLIDLGNSLLTARKNEQPGKVVHELDRQQHDYKTLLSRFEPLKNRIQSPKQKELLAKALGVLDAIPRPQPGAASNPEALGKLLKFVEGCETVRGRTYAPLSAELVAYFEREVVSEAEICRVFPGL